MKRQTKVSSYWRDGNLIWKFEIYKFSHEISDIDLKKWVVCKSGLPTYHQIHDGIIREIHVALYIRKELGGL